MTKMSGNTFNLDAYGWVALFLGLLYSEGWFVAQNNLSADVFFLMAIIVWTGARVIRELKHD